MEMSEPKILIPGSYTTEILIWLLWGRVYAVGVERDVYVIFQLILIIAKAGNYWASLIKLALKYRETIHSVSEAPETTPMVEMH